jgi:hypothetical protein
MRNFKILLLLVLFLSNLYGELPRTKTINDTIFTGIKDACSSGGDDVIRQYYLKIKGNRDDDFSGPPERRDNLGTGTYVTKAFLGAIDVELSSNADVLLIQAKDFLITYNPDPEYYLDLNEFWTRVDARDLSTIDMADVLFNVAYMVDFL